jgi:hypothetical protein
VVCFPDNGLMAACYVIELVLLMLRVVKMNGFLGVAT